MTGTLRIGAVDQAPIYDGKPAADALRRSVELARHCERLGYERYWIAEHHNTPSYASAAPEILMAAIAGQTQRIRVGSGGVMLSHYSPLKVAEVFSSLEALFPGRIDMGIGRAPGGSSLSTHALAYPGYPSGGELYPEQLRDLLALVRNDLPAGHPYEGLRAMPGTPQPPQPWILGSSNGSTGLAAALGAGFVLALFIGTEYRSPEIVRGYRQAFRAGGFGDTPGAMLASAVICAESLEEARFIASTSCYWKVQAYLHGNREPLRSPEEVQDLYRRLPPSDQAYYEESMNVMILGTPTQCRDQLERLSQTYGVDEIMAISSTYRFADRAKSYELLSEAMGLRAAPGTTPVTGEPSNI